jgi:hypothetical protein
MAYRQPYRGNPELKQYHLINDFSGGLDTTSLDEKMRDNEFREMTNIELAVQGSISNRKGFGELKHFNQWLEDNSIVTETGRTTFFKILKSDKPVLKWANDYTDGPVGYNLFVSRMQSETYELKILTATAISGPSIQFDLLTVANTDGTSGGVSVSLDNILTVNSATLKDKLNIKTFQYVQKIYFLSYDVYETTVDANKGIMVFNFDDETLSILTPDDTYIPTPIEVESFGFNVLRSDPIADVADQGFGDFAITGTYLTDVNGNYLEKIPPSGNFNIVAFQIGETMEPQDVSLTLKNQAGTEITAYNLGTVTDGGGYFTFPITNLKLDNVTSVTFEFTPTTYDSTAATLIDAVPVPNLDAIQANDLIGFSEDRSVLYKYVSGTTYLPASYTEHSVSFFSTLTVRDAFAGAPLNGAYSYVAETNAYYRYDTSSGNWVSQSTHAIYTSEASVFLVQDKLYSTYDIGTEVTLFYNYNGGTDYTTDDFNLLSLNEFLDFESTYFIGATETADVPIEPLDLDGAKMTQIQDRLVFYKGNSIYFSEQFQYDYVPNLNYVLLPLDSTDEITHINFFRGAYIVFTKQSIWRMSGTIFGQDFLVVKVNDFIGCIAPDSVRAVNNNLLFLSRQGLYVLTQSYYQEGLENVKKVDERISDIVPFDEDAYGVMYQEQYWLLFKEADYDNLKYYYNIDKVNGGRPFTTDTYTVKPENLEVFNGVIYSIRDGNYYRYDKDYTDFLPRNANSSVVEDYLYTYRFTTKNDDFGYATHDKKVKSVYFKIRAGADVLIGATIFVNELAVIDPNTYSATINEYGEVIYNKTFETNLEVPIDDPLGTFVLGKDTLGGSGVRVHKFVIGKKGKNFAITIEQKINGFFNIEDIGYLFKLGKVKESR